MTSPDLLFDIASHALAEGRTAMAFQRNLTGADLALLGPPGEGPALGEASTITRLRTSHHLLARLLAEGRRPVEVCSIVGYSQSRISVLQRDPAFQELIEYYRGQAETAYVNVHERLATLGMCAIEELQERLETNPERFGNRELKEIAESTFDRSIAPSKGAPKGSPQGASAQASGGGITIQFIEAPGRAVSASADGQTLTIEQKP